MKVIMPNGQDFEDWMAEWEEELKRKTLRNWINKKFPHSYAGGYNFYHAITHPWLFIQEWKRQIKWAWQRVFRGWDDTAVWSVDSYLAEIIPQLLTALKEKKQGIPISVFDDEPEVLEGGVIGYGEESMKKAEEKWDKILDTIIYGFTEYTRAENELVSIEEWKGVREKLSESFDLLNKYFDGLFD